MIEFLQNRGLYGALIISLGLHGVLLSWRQFGLPAENAVQQPVLLVGLVMHPSPPRAQAAQAAQAAASRSEQRTLINAAARQPEVGVKARIDSPAETVPAELNVPAATKSLPAMEKEVPVVAVAALSKEGVRDYRLALGREAHRFKQEFERRYSSLERERRRGWQGRVEMQLQASALGGVPALALFRSSGHAALDEQALELIGRAVQVTAMPTALRGQDFSLPLIMEFRLENE